MCDKRVIYVSLAFGNAVLTRTSFKHRPLLQKLGLGGYQRCKWVPALQIDTSAASGYLRCDKVLALRVGSCTTRRHERYEWVPAL